GTRPRPLRSGAVHHPGQGGGGVRRGDADYYPSRPAGSRGEPGHSHVRRALASIPIAAVPATISVPVAVIALTVSPGVTAIAAAIPVPVAVVPLPIPAAVLAVPVPAGGCAACRCSGRP